MKITLFQFRNQAETVIENYLISVAIRVRAPTVDNTGVREMVHNFILVSLKIRISNPISWCFALSFKNPTQIITSLKTCLSRFHGTFSIKNTYLEEFHKHKKYLMVNYGDKHSRIGICNALPYFEILMVKV